MKKKLIIASVAITLSLVILLMGEDVRSGNLPTGLARFKVIEDDILVPLSFDPVSPAATWTVPLWPGGVVPYEFDANVTPAHQTDMLNAMAEWESVANINFRPRILFESDYVHILESTVNRSNIGAAGGEQFIEIISWGNRWIICHELAHTLGFWHEQSRPDRDAYVQINLGNIQDTLEHNFAKHDDAGVYGPYDFESVMHYSQFAFCDAPCPGPTITVLPPHEAWQGLIGQRTHLSRLDVAAMSCLYPGDDWTFIDVTCQDIDRNGSFFFPYCMSMEFAEYNFGPGSTIVTVAPGQHILSQNLIFETPMTYMAPLGGMVVKSLGTQANGH